MRDFIEHCLFKCRGPASELPFESTINLAHSVVSVDLKIMM